MNSKILCEIILHEIVSVFIATIFILSVFFLILAIKELVMKIAKLIWYRNLYGLFSSKDQLVVTGNFLYLHKIFVRAGGKREGEENGNQ